LNTNGYWTSYLVIEVGALYGGGYVASLNEGNRTGYIISLTNLGQAEWWTGFPLVTNATSFTDGEYNTNLIIQAQGEGSYAAKIAKNHNGGGYNDWFLPAFLEWDTIYGVGNSNRTILNNNGANLSGAYWSSNESHLGFIGDPCCWSIQQEGYQAGGWAPKSTSLLVRAVRKFSY